MSLQIVKESIPNIFLTAPTFQHDFILTPAQQIKVEVPIKPSFDVRGSLRNPYFRKLVPLEIVDSQNKIIGTTLSSSLGKYKFTDLPGGICFVRIKEEFLKKNRLTSTPIHVAIDLHGEPGVRSASEISIGLQN